MRDFPAIQELLPHRGSMLLLDRIVNFSEGALIAEYAPKPTAWYADGAGNMPGWIGIELMAQAVAAHVGMRKRLAGLPRKMGALLGSRSYKMASQTSGYFSSGTLLHVHAQEMFRDESGLAAYECGIETDGRPAASATLKVYEPEDFSSFVRGVLE